MSEAKAAYATWPGDVAEMKQMAERLEKDNPRWIVVFGEYSREFVAFPRFSVPKGTVVSARYPGALPARMRAVETRARPRPADGATPARPTVPVPESSEERSSDVAR